MVRITRLTMIPALILLIGIDPVSAQSSSKTAPPQKNTFLDVSFEQEKVFINDVQINEISLNKKKNIQIVAIESISELPLDIAILMDASGSQRANVDLISQFYFKMIEAIPLRPIDSAALIYFNNQIDMVQRPTSEKTLLLNGFSKLVYVGPSSLFDAILLVSKTFVNQGGSRRAMVVITDGEDTSSWASIKEAYEKAIANNVRIYMFLMKYENKSELFNPTSFAEKHKKYATKTGGKVFKLYDLKSGKDQIMQMIDELNHLQRIRFSTDDPKAIKSGFEISVSRNGVKAYYASPLK